MMRELACLTLLVGAVAPLAAQPPAETKKLVVAPAALPAPALKYELLPELRDMTPGNGALLYQRAHSPEWWTPSARYKLFEKTDRWLEIPLSELPRKEMRFLATWPALRELDRAARREFCDWEMTERVKAEGIGMLLPDVQGFRSYANLLGVRCRLEMADGHFDKAVYTLQTGFALARDVAHAPTFINALVGIAIANLMTDRVEELIQRPGAPNLYWDSIARTLPPLSKVIQRPGAPNLYWALATLPEPFIDLRKPLQGERLFLQSTFPELKTIETTVWGPQQQQAFMSQLEQVHRNASLKASAELKFASIAMVIRAYPAAKGFLLAQGRSAAEIETMPAMQVALIYMLHKYQRFQDDYYKWVALPYWQARPGLQQADQELRTEAGRLDIFPFLEFMPAVDRIYEARVRLDRRLAALRCIEAVRLYAAAHAGTLPASLSDITEVPIPVDPVTGHRFAYSVAAGRVTLRESGLADGRPALPNYPLHYEVTFKR